jgi:xylulokinase
VEIREAATGRLLGVGSAPHPPTTPPVSEQNPADWWTALTLAFGRAVKAAGVTAQDVKALGVAAQCHGLVLQDATGRVLRPVKLWNDLTSAPQATAMVQQLGKPAWAEAVGSVPTAAFTITKLAWMAAHEPDTLQRAASACLPHDYLTWKLTGALVTDRSEASGTGYYAAHEGRYRVDLIERFAGVTHLRLPEVLGPSQAAGRVCAEAAAELGLPPDALVGPGGGDQHAGSLGLGLRTGQPLFTLGTSGVAMTVSENSVHDPTGYVNGVCDTTGRYLPLVCTLNATKVTDWFRRLLRLTTEEFDALALSVPPDQRSLTLAAFLDGERSPDLPDAVGILAGLSTATTDAQLARAAVDGVVLGLMAAFEAIESCGLVGPGPVVATGGGAASAAYRQSIADFLQREVVVLDAGDAAARGVCLQAAAILDGAEVDELRDTWRPAIAQRALPGQPVPAAIRERYGKLAAYRELDR